MGYLSTSLNPTMLLQRTECHSYTNELVVGDKSLDAILRLIYPKMENGRGVVLWLVTEKLISVIVDSLVTWMLVSSFTQAVNAVNIGV